MRIDLNKWFPMMATTLCFAMIGGILGKTLFGHITSYATMWGTLVFGVSCFLLTYWLVKIEEKEKDKQ